MKKTILSIALTGLVLAGFFALTSCRTAPIVSQVYEQGKPARGVVYTLPRTLVEVDLELEYFVTLKKGAGQEPPEVTSLFLGVSSSADPVKITAQQVNDWGRALVLTFANESGSAGEHEVEFGGDALLKSLNEKSEDKTAQVVANTLGAVLKAVTLLKSETSPEFKATGVKTRLRTTVPPDKLTAGYTLFGPEISTLKSGVPDRVKALYPGSKLPPNVTGVDKVSLKYVEDASGVLPGAITSSPADWIAQINSGKSGKAAEYVAGIFYPIPTARSVTLTLDDRDVVALATISVADNCPVGFVELRGRRFANLSHALAYFANTGGLQKIKQTRTSAAEGASGAVKDSAASIQQAVDSARTLQQAAETAAAAKHTAAEANEIKNTRALALKEQQLLNARDRKAKLEAELARSDLAGRDAKQQELYTISETVVTLETDIQLLKEGKTLP